MTRLFAESQPIRVDVKPDGSPTRFYWREMWHTTHQLCKRWRVTESWWTTDTQREYFKLTTTTGLLCEIYRDMITDEWKFARLFD